MREVLKKLGEGTQVICIGTYKESTTSQRMLVLNVEIYVNEKFVGKVNHLLVAKKPFKNLYLKNGDKVRFTGKVKGYKRQDTSRDFQIVVNKAKKIVDNN